MDSIRSIISQLRENRILTERKDYSNYSKEELISMAQEGDQLAVETLLKSGEGFIRMICRKYFLKAGDQEDLFQVGSVGYWQAIMDWNGEGNFDAFAGMYVKRAISKEIDKEAAGKSKINTDAASMDAKASASDEDDKTLGDTLPSSSTSLEDDILGREGARALKKFIQDNFNQKEREVIQKYIEGYKVKEISEVLGMPYKSAENILYKIKYKLKEYMKNNSFKESKDQSKGIEFSDVEKKLLRNALNRIKESESINESLFTDLSSAYENYTSKQLDKELDSIEEEIENIESSLKDTPYDTDEREDLLSALEDNICKISAMEDYLDDDQYNRSDELFSEICKIKDTEYEGYTKPVDPYEEAGMRRSDF